MIKRAAEIADAAGFASVTLVSIARSFDVQTPSLYTHVRYLAAVRDGVSILALDEVADVCGDAIAGRSERDALFRFAGAERKYLREHPGRWESLQRNAGPEVVNSTAARSIRRVHDAVLYGYGLSDEDRTHAIRIVGSAVNGFLNLERVGSFSHSVPDSERSWDQLLESLHYLLAQWHHRAGSPRERT